MVAKGTGTKRRRNFYQSESRILLYRQPDLYIFSFFHKLMTEELRSNGARMTVQSAPHGTSFLL